MPFNLIDAPWIPARFSTQRIRWIKPHEIVGDDPPLDIDWGRPELRAANYELLIGLFALAFADKLEDREDWRDLIDEPPSREELTERLARYKPSFTLDGEGPRFCQDLEELKGEIRSPDALLLDSPGENTLKNGADLFAKRDRFPVLSRAATAISIYALQAFATQGGAGIRASMRGGGPLTTLVVPQNATLWRRIAANLPLVVGERQPPDDLGLVFPWCNPTRVSSGDRKTECGPDAHWLQCYFGMPRRVRVVFAANSDRRRCPLTGLIDDVVATGVASRPHGVSYGIWRHPLAPYYKTRDGALLAVHAQDGHIGYRDWAAHLFAEERALQVQQYQNLGRPEKGARLSAMGS